MDFSDFDTAERVILARGQARRMPVNGTLELLPLCNMDCAMCYIRRSRAEVEAGGGLRPVEDWLRLGEEMARAGVLFLLLTGGEPLLYPGFRELYAALRRSGIILTVNTNGTLLDADWADFFAAHKPRRVNITLYGASDAAYETLCHHPGGYAKAVEAIRLLRARGVDVKINGSVTRCNLGDMAAIYRLGRELGAPVHMDTYMLPGLRERGLPIEAQSRLLPEDAAAAEIAVKKNEMPEEAFRLHVRRMIEQIERGEASYPGQITCLAGGCSFAIGWRGDMRPCVTFDAPAVNAMDMGFAAAWRAIAQEAQALRIAPACRRCRLRPVCKTCAASAVLETGATDGVPEYHCRYSEAYERLLLAERAE